MSLRWKIALGLAAIAIVVCTLAASGAYITTRRQLFGNVDDSLRTRAATAARDRSGDSDRDRDRDQPIDARGCPPPGALAPATAAQLVDASGRRVQCLAGAPQLPVEAVDRSIARSSRAPVLRTATVGGTRYRVLTTAWPGGALQTARSLEDTEEVLDSLRLRLLLLGAACVAGAALLGWLFARRLVRPIERLRRSAEQIARTQNLALEVPVAGGGEIGSLAESFTAMVGALGRSRREQQRLVTDASHELRTPLTSLRTNTELLDRLDELTDDQRRRVAAAIRMEVDELTHLVAEVVELASGAGEDEPSTSVALRDLAHSVVAVASARSDRILVVRASGDDHVHAQARMVERAIANLVDNALKYGRGAVEVRIEGHRLEVLDEGPGIPVDDLDQVFERFHRATRDRTAPGSGLGLAIVHEVVARHGGTTRARNRPGGGAAVGFELP